MSFALSVEQQINTTGWVTVGKKRIIKKKNVEKKNLKEMAKKVGLVTAVVIFSLLFFNSQYQAAPVEIDHANRAAVSFLKQLPKIGLQKPAISASVSEVKEI